MRSIACIAAAAFLLLFPAGTLGQDPSPPAAPAPAPGGSPLGPLAPGQPSAPPAEEPGAPEPVQPVDDDDELGGLESIALAGVALLIIAAVGVGISREGRKLEARTARKRRRRWGRPAEPAGRRGPTTSRAGSPVAGRRDRGKAPPPPPRKRRPKAKRR